VRLRSTRTDAAVQCPLSFASPPPAASILNSLARPFYTSNLFEIGGNMDKLYVEMHKDSLAGADLRGATLTFINIRNANFRGANLSGASFLGSFLAGSDLSNANLSNANLCIVNLRGANLSGTNLNGAIFNNKTVWPDGFDPIKAGAILSSDFG